MRTMSDSKGKWIVEGYEITQGIRIGDKEVVFGINEKADMPYLCSLYSANSIFESYEDSMAGDDYVEMVELFADRVKSQCVKVREEQEKVTVPREKITADMCNSTFQCGNLTGKVMAIKAEVLRPEYRSAEHQIVYVTGGNGARQDSFGTACYCITLYSGERSRWERYDFQGEIKPECLPEWAGERKAEIERQETAKTRQKQEITAKEQSDREVR